MSFIHVSLSTYYQTILKLSHRLFIPFFLQFSKTVPLTVLFRHWIAIDSLTSYEMCSSRRCIMYVGVHVIAYIYEFVCASYLLTCVHPYVVAYVGAYV